MKEQIQFAQQDTESIIEELLHDGSDPEALYLIEHHISSNDFDTLEQVAVEAFKLGYEATDPEEIEEQGQLLMTFDIISESPLEAELINSQIAQIIELTDKFGVSYDGWGTYFEGDEDDENEESDDDYDDDYDEDEDDEDTLH